MKKQGLVSLVPLIVFILILVAASGYYLFVKQEDTNVGESFVDQEKLDNEGPSIEQKNIKRGEIKVDVAKNRASGLVGLWKLQKRVFYLDDSENPREELPPPDVGLYLYIKDDGTICPDFGLLEGDSVGGLNECPSGDLRFRNGYEQYEINGKQLVRTAPNIDKAGVFVETYESYWNFLVDGDSLELGSLGGDDKIVIKEIYSRVK